MYENMYKPEEELKNKLKKESKDLTHVIKDTKFIFPSIYNAHSNSKSSNYNIP